MLLPSLRENGFPARASNHTLPAAAAAAVGAALPTAEITIWLEEAGKGKNGINPLELS